jgi:hypothetical protein
MRCENNSCAWSSTFKNWYAKHKFCNGLEQYISLTSPMAQAFQTFVPENREWTYDMSPRQYPLILNHSYNCAASCTLKCLESKSDWDDMGEDLTIWYDGKDENRVKQADGNELESWYDANGYDHDGFDGDNIHRNGNTLELRKDLGDHFNWEWFCQAIRDRIPRVHDQPRIGFIDRGF